MSIYVKNEANANRLLEWLDNGAPHTVFALDVSQMTYDEGGYEVHDDDLPIDDSNCGAVACMAGTAALMHDDVFGDPEAELTTDWQIVEQKAVEFLGIDRDVLPDQFEASMLDVFSPTVAEEFAGIDKVTAAQAAQALRNFIATGNPQWENV